MERNVVSKSNKNAGNFHLSQIEVESIEDAGSDSDCEIIDVPKKPITVLYIDDDESDLEEIVEVAQDISSKTANFGKSSSITDKFITNNLSTGIPSSTGKSTSRNSARSSIACSTIGNSTSGNFVSSSTACSTVGKSTSGNSAISSTAYPTIGNSTSGNFVSSSTASSTVGKSTSANSALSSTAFSNTGKSTSGNLTSSSTACSTVGKSSSGNSAISSTACSNIGKSTSGNFASSSTACSTSCNSSANRSITGVSLTDNQVKTDDRGCDIKSCKAEVMFESKPCVQPETPVPKKIESNECPIKMDLDDVNNGLLTAADRKRKAEVMFESKTCVQPEAPVGTLCNSSTNRSITCAFVTDKQVKTDDRGCDIKKCKAEVMFESKAQLEAPVPTKIESNEYPIKMDLDDIYNGLSTAADSYRSHPDNVQKYSDMMNALAMAITEKERQELLKRTRESFRAQNELQ